MGYEMLTRTSSLFKYAIKDSKVSRVLFNLTISNGMDLSDEVQRSISLTVIGTPFTLSRSLMMNCQNSAQLLKFPNLLAHLVGCASMQR
jgi:hypothetical protein